MYSEGEPAAESCGESDDGGRTSARKGQERDGHAVSTSDSTRRRRSPKSQDPEPRGSSSLPIRQAGRGFCGISIVN